MFFFCVQLCVFGCGGGGDIFDFDGTREDTTKVQLWYTTAALSTSSCTTVVVLVVGTDDAARR